MNLEDKKANITDCHDEAMNKKKIVQLGKVMAIVGAGTLAAISIALVKSVTVFRVF
ncbi:MAG: hypothetical protein ACOH2E_08550 [Candidatus Paracaedibacter sp.]|jgi:hypothetical protein